jgi:membrane protein involved in colicin uptake
MESPTDIKAALTTRARTATLDELRTEGKRRVRVVKADQITQMIEESVHRAVEQSGLLPASEVEKLVERSRVEFRALMKAREAEAERAQAMTDMLAAQEREVAELRRQLAAAKAAQQAAEEALAASQAAQAAAAPAAAEAEEAAAQAMAQAAAHAQAELLASLRDEMAGMKAALMAQPPVVAAPGAASVVPFAPAAAAAGAPAVPGVAAAAASVQAAPAAAAAAAAPAPAVDVSAAIEKLASSLNDRFEKLGKKMGISSAVGGDQPVDLGGLFKSADDGLESNMNTVETKQKSGGGIAANLARLKKLKGGG